MKILPNFLLKLKEKNIFPKLFFKDLETLGMYLCLCVYVHMSPGV